MENKNIAKAYYPFEFGVLEIVFNEVLLGLKVDRTREYPDKLGVHTNFTEKVYNQITEYLFGKRKEFTIPYYLEGTEFQRKVWEELRRIPYGRVATYGEIAKRIGNSNAQRAVGGACGANPIWIIIPCHRVVASNGLGGYAGNLDMKKELLRREDPNGICTFTHTYTI